MFVPRSPGVESALRALLGLYALLDTLERTLPLETNFRPFSAFSILFAVLLGLGFLDRLAGLCLFLIWWLRPVPPDAWQLDAGISVLFLAACCVPRTPFGSWSARGRLDPGEGWTLPGWITNLRMGALFAALPMIALPAVFPLDANRTWEVQSDVGRLWGVPVGLAELSLACMLLPLCFTQRALAWWWLLFLAGLLYTAGEPEKSGSIGTLAWLLVFTAPLERVPELAPGTLDRVWYDGQCGLCHGAVRWLIAEDADGSRFRFAPLAEEARSMRIECADGRWLEGSAAPLHCMRRLGGGWRLIGEILRWVPPPVRDGAYFLVARVRYAFFGRRQQSCPTLARHLQQRFR